MIGQARRELTTAGIDQAPGTVLADAGCWHAAHIEVIAADGCQVA